MAFVPELGVNGRGRRGSADVRFEGTLRGGSSAVGSAAVAQRQVSRSVGRMSVADYRKHFSRSCGTTQNEDVPSATGSQSTGAEECCVCFSRTSSLTPCGHPVCSACLHKLVQPTCPYCRRHLQLPEKPSTVWKRLASRPRGPSAQELLSQIPTATLSHLVSLASQAQAFHGSSEWYEMRRAVTSRCIECAPDLALRGLTRHADALVQLQTAGLLCDSISEEEAVSSALLGQHRSIRTALEDSLLNGLENMPGCSLQGLRPAARLFCTLRDNRLIREACVVEWFTQRMLSILDRLRVDQADYIKDLVIAAEFATVGAVDRIVLERHVHERWADFVRREGSVLQRQQVEQLRDRILESLNPKT